MGITGKARTHCCPHRGVAYVEFINNDGSSPPVIYVDGIHGPSVISLTNQVIRVSCINCFDEIRRAVSQIH